RLRRLLLRGEVLPEIRHGEHAVRARERFLQTLNVVDVGGDDLRALRRERARFLLTRIARDRAAGEAAGSVGEDRAADGSALGAGGSENSDDFLFGHARNLIASAC